MFGIGSSRKKKDDAIIFDDDEDFFPIYIQQANAKQKSDASSPRTINNPATANEKYIVPDKKEVLLESKPKIQAPIVNPKKKITHSALESMDTGMLSIKDMLNEGEGSKEEETEEDFSNRPRDTFDAEQLEEAWKEYCRILRKQHKSSFTSLLQTCNPKIGARDKILLTLENSVQESELNQEKSELLAFLRNKLNNWGIVFETSIRKKEEKIKYYTNRERFDRLVELHPQIIELKKKLNFDPDY